MHSSVARITISFYDISTSCTSRLYEQFSPSKHTHSAIAQGDWFYSRSHVQATNQLIYTHVYLSSSKWTVHFFSLFSCSTHRPGSMDVHIRRIWSRMCKLACLFDVLLRRTGFSDHLRVNVREYGTSFNLTKDCLYIPVLIFSTKHQLTFSPVNQQEKQEEWPEKGIISIAFPNYLYSSFILEAKTMGPKKPNNFAQLMIIIFRRFAIVDFDM